MMEKESIEMNLLQIDLRFSASRMKGFASQAVLHNHIPVGVLFISVLYLVCTVLISVGTSKSSQGFSGLPLEALPQNIFNLQAPLNPSIAICEKKSEIKFEILFEKSRNRLIFQYERTKRWHRSNCSLNPQI